ncbi:hypothetical protein C1894_13600 [Pseudomonas sp. FW305-3-2-15-E-TSA2]|nr:hypothetical protein C1895_09820 [Pseudomonas sp. FW305-3-2-15-E-TSA4]POA41830.1 hypothetical protein C1894_13600 [Pseudomonas sp. FW305-3-2-15-E-TSA2]
MGAGLLAKASDQSTSLFTERPLSRASPLPQGDVFQQRVRRKTGLSPPAAPDTTRSTCGPSRRR